MLLKHFQNVISIFSLNSNVFALCGHFLLNFNTLSYNTSLKYPSFILLFTLTLNKMTPLIFELKATANIAKSTEEKLLLPNSEVIGLLEKAVRRIFCTM